MQQYVSMEDFDRYRRFMSMQAQSLFIQLEDLRTRINNMTPAAPIPKGRRIVLDKQVENMYAKINFLERQITDLKNINQ